MLDDWLFLYSSQVKHLWFQEKQLREGYSQQGWCVVERGASVSHCRCRNDHSPLKNSLVLLTVTSP